MQEVCLAVGLMGEWEVFTGYLCPDKESASGGTCGLPGPLWLRLGTDWCAGRSLERLNGTVCTPCLVCLLEASCR